jgi:hypothetical protein
VLTYALLLLAVAIFLRRRRRVSRTLVASDLPKRRPRPPSVRRERLTVADAAYRYERAVLEVDDVSEWTKNRALLLLAEKIVPLTGTLDLDDLVLVHAGVRLVLAEEEGADRGVVVVWDDFVRWSRFHLGGSRRSLL